MAVFTVSHNHRHVSCREYVFTMPPKSASLQRLEKKIVPSVSETTIGEGILYPKRQKSSTRTTGDSATESVSETTKPLSVYAKQRNSAKRIRNDESSGFFDEEDLSGREQKLDSDSGLQKKGRALVGAAKAKLAEDEAYEKRRILRQRMRNDETYSSVSETTKGAGVYAKQRKMVDRMRNDETLSVSALSKAETARSKLLPEYHPNEDLFICDVLDAIPKDDMATMEHPIFTLSTRPDMREIHYSHNGNTVDIYPSAHGMATIHDKDILIYCVSQLIAKMNNNEPVNRTLSLKAYDLLVWSNRQTSGDGYARLINALDRLAGTRIKTNIKADDEEITQGFGLITEYKVVRNQKTGQMMDVKVTLSDWLFKMVQGKSVLTLHRDYFRLRKPLERRIYELARKHCGAQPRWPISTALLQKKTGSAGNIRLFRQALRELEQSNHLPDYLIELEDENVVFHHRGSLSVPAKSAVRIPFVDEEGMHDAKLVAPGYDVHALYQEWGDWWQTMDCPELKNPNAAFVGFCRKKNEKSPIR